MPETTTALLGKRPAEEDSVSNKRLCQDAPASESTFERIKKRKVVLLLGYCGQGFLGMQRNIGFRTIEEELLTSLLKANYINDDSFSQMQNIQFQRAARTDKGVSAVRQVVSLKLPEQCSIEEINKHLPEVIRVFAMKRVTKGFNSKSSCDARTYSYMCPTAAFSTTDTSEEYRITADIVDKINEALNVFTGTHNFHNFTAKKKAQDPSAFRYILNFECGEPFVVDNMEFITMKVKGQSFMLHQIRKMVGTVIAIVRGLTTRETISKAWGESRFDLPIAPGLGLVLEQVHYDRYNTKFGKDGMHETLTWDEHEEEIAAFKRKYIDSVIVETEKKEKSMLTWIETLHLHTFDVRDKHLHQVANDNEETASSNGGATEETSEDGSSAPALQNNQVAEGSSDTAPKGIQTSEDCSDGAPQDSKITEVSSTSPIDGSNSESTKSEVDIADSLASK